MVSNESITLIILSTLIYLVFLIIVYVISHIVFKTYFSCKLKYKKDLDKLKWEINNGVSK